MVLLELISCVLLKFSLLTYFTFMLINTEGLYNTITVAAHLACTLITLESLKGKLLNEFDESYHPFET